MTTRSVLENVLFGQFGEITLTLDLTKRFQSGRNVCMIALLLSREAEMFRGSSVEEYLVLLHAWHSSDVVCNAESLVCLRLVWSTRSYCKCTRD